MYCWTSVCLAEEKTLSRKCFPQLLGVSFPTLRPTKRQIAAKSRDSSAAEMPFGLIPALSKHSSHTCLPQWAGPFHLHQGNWLVKQHCLISSQLSNTKFPKPSAISDQFIWPILNGSEMISLYIPCAMFYSHKITNQSIGECCNLWVWLLVHNNSKELIDVSFISGCPVEWYTVGLGLYHCTVRYQ